MMRELSGRRSCSLSLRTLLAVGGVVLECAARTAKSVWAPTPTERRPASTRVTARQKERTPAGCAVACGERSGWAWRARGSMRGILDSRFASTMSSPIARLSRTLPRRALRTVHSSAGKTDGNAETSSSYVPRRAVPAHIRSRSESTPTQYSRLQDAYSGLFAALPASSYGTRPPPPSPSLSGTPERVPSRRRAQTQRLTDAEAEAFAGLMSTFLPESFAVGSTAPGARKPDLLGLEVIQNALRKKVVAREMNWARKTKATLTRAQEERLDEMKEKMMSFATDVELLAWSMTDVFGFSTSSLFPDPRAAPTPTPESLRRLSDTSSVDDLVAGPSSPIYSELLLALFILLRQTHRSPHAALHVFSLASLTPHSYVLGCTTAVYNEVLRTRWMEGDVLSVASGLEEMLAGGVRIDDGTRAIVAAVGETIRNDTTRAEARAKEALPSRIPSSSSSSPSAPSSTGRIWPSFDEASSLHNALSDEMVDGYRFFSPVQLAAWGRMESIVEENIDERARKKQDRENDSRAMWEDRKSSQERSFAPFEEARDEHLGRRDKQPESGFSFARTAARSTAGDVRLEPRQNEDEHDEDGVEASWRNFPAFEERTEQSRLERDEAAERERDDMFKELSARRIAPGVTSRNYRQLDQPRSSRFSPVVFPSGSTTSDDLTTPRTSDTPAASSKPAPPRETSTPSSYSSFFDNTIETLSRSPSLSNNPDNPERVIPGGVESLPKRPSSLNPYKIRRKGLSKIEKARFDTPHPMLFWKKR